MGVSKQLLFMHEFRKIGKSLANPLCKGKGSLAFVIFSLWLFLGLPILGERLAEGWNGSFVSKNRKNI